MNILQENATGALSTGIWFFIKYKKNTKQNHKRTLLQTFTSKVLDFVIIANQIVDYFGGIQVD